MPAPAPPSAAPARWLDRARTVAPPDHDRWLVPPAALAIHLCIGQAYAFSVFNLPLTRTLGVTTSAPGDWSLATVGWVFSAAIVALGLSAALFGAWLERAGPRKAMVASAACFCGGLLVAALGVRVHSVALLLLGYGVLGGVGLGLGYIAPVSTLLKWFPDRPGMATGLAIMGFGGGALVAAPLSVRLMAHFATPTSTGVAPTFVTLALGYLALMLFGAWLVRVPPEGWTPGAARAAVDLPRIPLAPAVRDVAVGDAVRTPQFRRLWLMLFVNVTAGIGVLGQASAMSQELFPGRIDAGAAAGFVGLLSLANLAGRFAWASLSDRIGRRATYATFFALGAATYAAIPLLGRAGSVVGFVAACALVLTMYGGGFATIPAYLRDLFGTREVGAIHGRLLTAWALAGVAGPALVNYMRQWQLARGAAPRDAYGATLWVMAALLLVGLVAALGVRGPVAVAAARGDAALGERPLEAA